MEIKVKTVELLLRHTSLLSTFMHIHHLLGALFYCVRHIFESCSPRQGLTKAGSSNILVHMVGTYDAFQAVLGFLCRHGLRLPDVHAHFDALAANNGMVRGCTDNPVSRHALVNKCIISASTIYRHICLTSGFHSNK